jgi:hypothetical protein
MKRFIVIFLVAFALNIVWENLHSFLYDSNMGGKITELTLLRASTMDALIIILILLPFLYFTFFKKRTGLIIVIGIILGILIEWVALHLNIWTYNQYMPIVPYFEVGLTPAIQLGLLGYFSFRIQKSYFKSDI